MSRPLKPRPDTNGGTIRVSKRIAILLIKDALCEKHLLVYWRSSDHLNCFKLSILKKKTLKATLNNKDITILAEKLIIGIAFNDLLMYNDLDIT